MLNKLMTGWAAYCEFVKENAEISRAYQEKALLDHRIKRRMESEVNSLVNRSLDAKLSGRTGVSNELSQEAQRLKDSYKTRKFY